MSEDLVLAFAKACGAAIGIAILSAVVVVVFVVGLFLGGFWLGAIGLLIVFLVMRTATNYFEAKRAKGARP